MKINQFSSWLLINVVDYWIDDHTVFQMLDIVQILKLFFVFFQYSQPAAEMVKTTDSLKRL